MAPKLRPKKHQKLSLKGKGGGEGGKSEGKGSSSSKGEHKQEQAQPAAQDEQQQKQQQQHEESPESLYGYDTGDEGVSAESCSRQPMPLRQVRYFFGDLAAARVKKLKPRAFARHLRSGSVIDVEEHDGEVDVE